MVAAFVPGMEGTRCSTIDTEGEGKEIRYAVWPDCEGCKWIEVYGLYLVNPEYLQQFKQRHSL
jgi:hypothetical protein